MYITFIFGGFVEIPALLLMFSIVDRVGRKPIICGGYIIAAICMLSNPWMGEDGLLLCLAYKTCPNASF